MDLDVMLNFLGWCSALNIGFLIYWLCFLLMAQGWVYRYTCKWIVVSEEDFRKMHFLLIGAYKLLIIFFNLVPYLVLRVLS